MHGGPIAFLAVGARLDGGVANQGDARVPHLDQMVRRAAPHAHVVDSHSIGARVGDRTVEGDDRDSQVQQLRDLRPPRVGWRQDHPEHALFGQHIQIGALLLGVLIGVAQQDSIAQPECRVLHGAHHLREVWVLDVGDQHADHVHLLPAEVPCQAVGSILQLVDRTQHPLTIGCLHPWQAIQDAGYRRRGDPRPPGDILDTGARAIGLA